MPNNKGSRIAASQARAKAAARRKTRAAGPDLSGATKPVELSETDLEAEEQDEPMAVAPAATERLVSQPVRMPGAMPSPYRRASTRRERQALNVISGGSLKWELSLIMAIAAICGVALAVLKLATDFGR